MKKETDFPISEEKRLELINNLQELPEIGQVVWVRDRDIDDWQVSHFIEKISDNYYLTSDSNNDNSRTDWIYLTTKNPYKNEN